MTNCFCGMVDRRKAFSLISSRGHCQRSSPLRISDAPQAGFEPAQNLSSGFVEWSCAVVITTTPGARHHATTSRKKYSWNKQITRYVSSHDIFLIFTLFALFSITQKGEAFKHAKRWGIQSCISNVKIKTKWRMETKNIICFFFFFNKTILEV